MSNPTTSDLARKRAEKKYKDMCWTSEEEERQDFSMKVHAEAEEPLLELLKVAQATLIEARKYVDASHSSTQADFLGHGWDRSVQISINNINDLLAKINTILEP